ncbi:hypothetical protein ACW2QC_09250 [Virgibacillus sp. FSP13]
MTSTKVKGVIYVKYGFETELSMSDEELMDLPAPQRQKILKDHIDWEFVEGEVYESEIDDAWEVDPLTGNPIEGDNT